MAISGMTDFISIYAASRRNGSFPFTGGPGNVSKGNEKAIADLLSGRRKNSYGAEGMRITGRSDWKRIINVSDEMKQHVFEDVKKEFQLCGRML